MNTTRIVSIDDIKTFLQGTDGVDITITSRKEKYHFVSDTLVRLKYNQLRKRDQSLVKKYILKVTDYSDKQYKRIVRKWRDGVLLAALSPQRNSFPCLYGPVEIGLLATADHALNFPNGFALKESLVREYAVFNNEEYEVISKISVSHIYNIRKNSLHYKSKTMHYVKTNPVSVPIGERTKPVTYGKPGFMRVDSVHQGDFEGQKGVYHINLVDEVTQWEVVGCVPKISERYLIPMLEDLLGQLPFSVLNFHSDNGSEYINYQVASMLERLVVKQTKSRSRKTNDQALVEGKNGSVIRKHMGRNHIPKKYAPAIYTFYKKYFNVFLNYHRVCCFATVYTDRRGKVRKKYDTYMTPYMKFRSLKNTKKYLKPDVTFAQLDKIAYAQSDIAFAQKMKEEKEKLFKK